MKIQETLSQGLKREFDVKIPASEIEKSLHTRLESIGKRVKIPGFRPGKVPLPLLKQRYKGEALSDVLQEFIDKAVKQVIKENELKPALQPKVDVSAYDDGKDLSFKMKMEVLPIIG